MLMCRSVDVRMCRCRKSIRTLVLLCFVTLFMLSSCRDDNFTPRPRGFYRIAVPAKKYQTYDPANCPFTFDYPVYATVIPDTDRLAEPCWMDVVYPQFKATLYFS